MTSTAEHESGISALMARHGRSGPRPPELDTSMDDDLDGEEVTEPGDDSDDSEEPGSGESVLTSSSRMPSRMESSVMGTDSGIMLELVWWWWGRSVKWALSVL